MGKASTSKKVARAARAGGSPSARKRNWLFPASLVAIVVVGVAVVLVAKSPTSASAAAPAVGDHWHNAYGVYVCDKFLDPIPTPANDPLGIHTHGDGVIHIHPFQGGSAGKNATMKIFSNTVGLKWSDHGFTMPDGSKYADGYDCNGQPAKVSVWKWTDALGANTGPEQITSNFPGIRFTDNFAAFTIAVVPDGVVPPEPDLARLKDIANGGAEDPTATTPATAAATATTAPTATTATTTATP